MNIDKNETSVRISVISDTHGLLRNDAARNLAKSDHILHAGDIDTGDCLEEIKLYQNASFVLGNMDRGVWSLNIPETRIITIAGKKIFMIHNLLRMPIDPVAENIDVVIFGHTHLPELNRKNGILFLNPGSAGPKRSEKPVSMAFLTITNGSISAEHIQLTP